MHIRPYAPSDEQAVLAMLPALQDIVAALDPFGRYRPAAKFDAQRLLKKIMKDNSSLQGGMFVAEEEGKLVGYVTATAWEYDEDDDIAHLPGNVGRVHELYVEPAFRKQQVGLQLLKAAEEHLKGIGCDHVRLDCLAGNTAAQQFYRKNGYSERNIDFMKKIP